jgi:hypothetical protein
MSWNLRDIVMYRIRHWKDPLCWIGIHAWKPCYTPHLNTHYIGCPRCGRHYD